MTPRRNSWSFDTWLRTGKTTYFPSRAEGLQQSLYRCLPIALTTLNTGETELRTETYTVGSRVVHRVSVVNTSNRPMTGSVGLAVRPFNPEGVALVNTLTNRHMGFELVVNGSDTLHFGISPSRILMSNRSGGDAAWMFDGTRQAQLMESITCPAGLATGVAEFFLALAACETWNCTVWIDLADRTDAGIPSIEHVTQKWGAVMAHKAHCSVPDAHLTNLLAASRSSLLTSLDGNTITPGPATYHYFWFRDAAYLILALDRLGMVI